MACIVNIHNTQPDENALYELAEFFRVFGDSTRIRILYALLDCEKCVIDIAQELNISQSAVSHQLQTLRAKRLVKYRREGKTVYYSLADDHIFSIINQVSLLLLSTYIIY